VNGLVVLLGWVLQQIVIWYETPSSLVVTKTLRELKKKRLRFLVRLSVRANILNFKDIVLSMVGDVSVDS